jgi:glutamate/tyrosine decarboxylase-like PLP-dependent enzyme
MLWDQALPAVIGYFGAMLYNQNNVAAEASPLTTHLEIEVGNDLCRMLGFTVPSSWPPPAGLIAPWGHITCDGSVANIEALWASRNAKFFAFALREALRHDPRLRAAHALQVRLLDGSSTTLIDIDDPWVLLNLKIDDVVPLPQAIKDSFGIDASITNAALSSYSVQNIGLIDFYNMILPSQIRAPVVIVPATRHYSWPKAATLLGLGQNQVKKIHVDLHARMNMEHLKTTLSRCLEDNIPVVAVVAVIGSTEESAVDPLGDILAIRAEFRQLGFDFAIHCDAAWGGYFNSIRTAHPGAAAPAPSASPAMSTSSTSRLAFLEEVPRFPMSKYVNAQYAALKDADSITVDPHKAGYVPYPAGAVSYRNSLFYRRRISGPA